MPELLRSVSKQHTVGHHAFDLLVIGAGPAGIACAVTAAENGQRVLWIDDNSAAGGQIWRGRKPAAGKTATDDASLWLSRAARCRATRWTHAQLVAREAESVLIEYGTQLHRVRATRIVLCSGARERFIPFPGWTLPGVTGLGGVQALVKSGWDLRGKRVVLAGSGPLLFAAAETLLTQGAKICLIAEQTPRSQWWGFAADLLHYPEKWQQAIGLLLRCAFIPQVLHSQVIKVEGHQRVESVTVKQNGRQRKIACDVLACAYGLIPNSDIASLFDCRRENGAVAVNEWQQTSNTQVFAAGEIGGIGGVDKALVEGEIAGWVCAGQPDRAQALFGQRARQYRYMQMLSARFALRPELYDIVTPECVVCRCEDVTDARLRAYRNGREARLLSRAGMGACQGRTCGPICTSLYGWSPVSARPPLRPLSYAAACVTDEERT